MKRRWIVCLGVALLLGAGCHEPPAPEIVHVEDGDLEMDAAIDEAQATFPQYLEHIRTSDDGDPGLVKVRFSDPAQPDREAEDMWIQPIDLTDGNMRGELLGRPEWLTTVKEGDEVAFTRDDVSDWLFIKDGRAIGAYTVQLLRKRMTPAERAAHDAGYPFAFE